MQGVQPVLDIKAPLVEIIVEDGNRCFVRAGGLIRYPSAPIRSWRVYRT